MLPRFVETVGTLEPSAHPGACHEQLPNGRTNVVFRVLEEGQRGDLCIVGPRTRAVFKDASGISRALIVRLKPGWSGSLLGIGANVLRDRIVHLEDIWGRPGRDLLEALLATPTLTEALDKLSHAIALRAGDTFEPASAHLARQAARLFEADEVRVERVAERLGVTARHLRRVFVESVGVTPKDFARGVRLQRALRMAATSRDWSRIAADAGYYDQAHLIGDFRELIGSTPDAFARARASTTTDAHRFGAGILK